MTPAFIRILLTAPAAMVAFVLLLEPGLYKLQFKQLAWTALIILITTFQSSFYIHNIFAGMIWYAAAIQ
jgi:hypothetical protein